MIHWHWFHGIGQGYQHTIPLLFDDCYTILEKIDALWCKLNALIEDYDQFKQDFAAWKKQVEDAIDALQKEVESLKQRVSDLERRMAVLEGRVSTLETEVKSLKERVSSLETRMSEVEKKVTQLQKDVQSLTERLTQLESKVDVIGDRVTSLESKVSSIGDRVTKLESDYKSLQSTVNNYGSDITDLKERVKKLEDLLKSLNIVVPEELFKAGDPAWFATSLSTPFLQKLVSAGGLQSGLYRAEQKLYPEDNDPGVALTAGYLGFAIIQSKMPLIFSAPNDTGGTAESLTGAQVSGSANARAFVNAYRKYTMGNDLFVPVTLYAAPTFDIIDEFKYPSAYAVVGDTGFKSQCYLMELDGSAVAGNVSQPTVRWQFTKGSKSAKFASFTNQVMFYVSKSDNRLRATMIGEHQ